MKITETKIPGVLIIEPELYQDPRGYFTKIFDEDTLSTPYPIKEINKSYTYKKGTIRGMHIQKDPMAQDKMVQCPLGRIYDVAVDLRPESPTYKQWVGVEILGEKMLLVPKGCAHGFQTLENFVFVQYFVSQHYSPEHEYGVRFDDPAFGIEWMIKDITTSEKDTKWELF